MRCRFERNKNEGYFQKRLEAVQRKNSGLAGTLYGKVGERIQLGNCSEVIT